MNNSNPNRTRILNDLKKLQLKIKPNCQVNLKCDKENILQLNFLYINNPDYCSVTVYEDSDLHKIEEITGIMEWLLVQNIFPNGSYLPSDFEKLKSDIEKLKKKAIKQHKN